MAARRGHRPAGHNQICVFAFSAALGALAVVGYLAFVRDAPTVSGPLEVSWILLAIGFALSDQFAIHVEFGEHAHSFNLNELPFVVGLFLCDPRLLVLARVMAACVVLTLVQRQLLVKLVFNICLAALESVVVVAIFVEFRALAGNSTNASWIVAIAAAAAVTVVQAVAILTAVRLSGGRPEPRQALLTGVIGVVTATATASLAIATVTLLEFDVVGGTVIMALIASVLFSAYRGYAVVSQRYASLAKLYGFTKSLARSPEFDAAMRITLQEACALLRAERAELCLLDRDEQDGSFVRLSSVDGRVDVTVDEDFTADAMRRFVADTGDPVVIPRHTRDAEACRYLADKGVRDVALVPLTHSDDIVGTLAVYNRRGDVSTFDRDDMKVFETLANHASVSLENAQLISRLRREVAEKRHQALHDPLTELGNRSLLTERTDLALASRKEHELVAVLLMDLNRFKDVNDTLGHQHGDALLCEVALRLQASAPSGATITRLGGDEFAVLLPQLTAIQQAVAVASRIQLALQEPFFVDDLQLAVAASIGVALAPNHGTDTAALLQHADIAMYLAKEAADSGVALYDNAQNQHSERRLTLAAELREAIEADELDVYYQPKADLATGRLLGVEALARWQHPTYGPVPPDEFVPLAERTGLIRPLTLLVLRRALGQLRSWHDMGLDDLHVAVNLSARSLMSGELVDDVERALRAADVPAEALTLELTETQMMADPARTIAVLDLLAATGADISVDDFGTGYSSLSYLQRLPVDELKIDRSFVLDMMASDAKRTIVQTIINLGRNLNLRVVAEGIEDVITWDALTALGCDIGQGYYLSRPVPPARLTPWLLARMQPPPGESENADPRVLHVVR